MLHLVESILKREGHKMEALEIRILNQEQMETLYKTKLQEDFPANELKPLSRLVTMMEEGIYECTGLYSGEKLAAYAFFVRLEERGYYLLDYLAVEADFRGQGLGSIYMQKMKEYFPDCKGLFIECESESELREATPENASMLAERRNRIRFYLNNGAVLTNLKSFLFSPEYSILYLAVQGNPYEVEWYDELRIIYQAMFPINVWNERVRLWSRRSALLEVSRGSDSLEPKVSLVDALNLRGPVEDGTVRMISLIGSGGKTTTMYQLADELSELGKTVMVTTTTHTGIPTEGVVFNTGDIEDCPIFFGEETIMTVGSVVTHDGIQKLAPPKNMELLLEKTDIILVEADGAKGFPLKLMAGHEPVIPERTDLVIDCAGLQAIGRTWQEGCFRFETCGEWLKKSPEEIITAEDVAAVIMKQKAAYPYYVVLNQADTAAEKALALEVIGHLPRAAYEQVAVTNYNKEIICEQNESFD